MEKIDLLRKRIDELRKLTKSDLFPQNDSLKAFNAGYDTALMHVIEMMDF